MVMQEKEVSNRHYQELSRLREISFNLDKDIDAQKKRIDILRSEAENNEQRILSINDMLAQRDDAIHRTMSKIQDCHQQIQELKYNLNKLDGELGYFESQNEQHKAAQQQLLKANDHEYMQGKDLALKL